jgi:hypothetical protein
MPASGCFYNDTFAQWFNEKCIFAMAKVVRESHCYSVKQRMMKKNKKIHKEFANI